MTSQDQFSKKNSKSQIVDDQNNLSHLTPFQKQKGKRQKESNQTIITKVTEPSNDNINLSCNSSFKYENRKMKKEYCRSCNKMNLRLYQLEKMCTQNKKEKIELVNIINEMKGLLTKMNSNSNQKPIKMINVNIKN